MSHEDAPLHAAIYESISEMDQWRAAQRQRVAPRVEGLEQAIEFLDGIVMIAERPDDQRATHSEEMAAIRWMAGNAVRLVYESLAGVPDEPADEVEGSDE